MGKSAFFQLFAVLTFSVSAQNAGIGTNNPLSKLHVAGCIRSDTLIGPGVRSLFAAPNGRIYDSLVTPSTLNWEITGNSNITPLNFLGTTNANDVIFKTNNLEHARILSGGGVGIETALLDFASTRLQVNGGHILAGDPGGVVFKDPAGGVGFKYWQFRPSNLTAGDFVIKTLNDLGVTQLDVMAMTRAGNIGMGTLLPGNKLEITSATANTSGLRFTNLTSASPTVVANGKALSVNASGDVVLIPSAADAWQLLGNAGTVAGTNFLGTTDAQDLVFKTNNMERGRMLAANGFLGLGTTTPGTKLEVSAIGGDGITIRATAGPDVGDLIFLDGAGGEKGRVYTNPLVAPGLIFSGSTVPAAHMFINNVGNVGIGNSSPANRVHITSAVANTSGLRLANLTSASPTVATNGKALSVDINGDVVLVPSAADAWQLLGNTGTVAGTNFLGTTDAQDLVFKTNSAEQGRFLVNGNLGLGTAIPAERLHINGNAQIGNVLGATGTGNYLTFSDLTNNTDVLSIFRSNTIMDESNLNISIGDNFSQPSGIDRFNVGAYGAGFNNIFTVTSEGRVGIGQYSPGSLFHIKSAAVTGNPMMTFESGPMLFNAYVNTTLVGYTNPAGVLYWELGGAETYMFGGEIIPDADGQWNLGAATKRWNTLFATNGVINTSDARLKKDVSQISFGLNEVLKLQPVEYNWKDETYKNYCNGKKLGFLAQDLEKIIPNVVYIPKAADEQYGVNYEALIPVLTRSIQELNEKLEAKTNELKAQNNSYQAQIDELKKMIEGLKKQ